MKTTTPKQDGPARTVAIESKAHREMHGENAALGPDMNVRLGSVNDACEREADAVAEQLVTDKESMLHFGSGNPPNQTPVETLQTKPELIQRQEAEEEEELVQAKPSGTSLAASGTHAAAAAVSIGGQPLGSAERSYFEPRFGRDLSHVRLHTGPSASQAAQGIKARAYTLRNNIAFAPGQYQPNSHEGRRLLAHELTHTLQQGHGNTVRRAVELRPPGRGEASAFDRAQELVDRLNAQSTAITYTLNGRVLEYTVNDEPGLQDFDRRMIAFIDEPQTLPLRLITSSGRVGGANLFVDSFITGYMDLDDMMASDDVSFRMNMIHILTERNAVPDYARKIGTNMGGFNRAHRLGNEAEADHLKAVLGDPTIRFNYEETRPNGTTVFGFKSDEGYRVFHIFGNANSATRGGVLRVRTADGRRISLDDFLAERAAAAAAGGVAAGAAAGAAAAGAGGNP